MNIPTPGSSNSPVFDDYDEFLPENIPEPGSHLVDHDVLTGQAHVALHRLTRELFDERGVHDTKVVCGYFEPEQFIPVHAPDSDVTIIVQQGRSVVRDGDEEHAVEPGDVVSVPAGTDRGVRAAEERLEAVLVTAPPLTDAEHEPVRKGLQRGEFDPE